ncbi:MAG: succinate dehydrogenase [Candidatus Binatia bacterium]
MSTDRREFYLRRLHSLSGIVPIGAYVVVHIMLENVMVLGGPGRFDALVQAIGAMPPPLLLAIEVFGLWGPILFHAVYGVVRVRQASFDDLRADNVGSYLYVLQRLTGVIAFVFIAYHVWSTRVQYYLGRAEIDFAFMHAKMIDPLVMAVYLVGVGASVFHFCNGIWTFCVTWGLTVRVEAQRAVRAFSMVLFAVMYGTAFAILMAFRA